MRQKLEYLVAKIRTMDKYLYGLMVALFLLGIMESSPGQATSCNFPSKIMQYNYPHLLGCKVGDFLNMNL